MTIYEKLLLIQSELKAPKGQTNTFGHYKYRNCEDILEAVKPLCVKQKCVAYLSDVLVAEGNRYYIQATATLQDCESEQFVRNTSYAREEETKKGMDGSQITGASSSYARKYALNGLFAIDDTKDSDATNDGNAPPQTQKEYYCKKCKAKIIDLQANGKTLLAKDLFEQTGGLCWKCHKAQKEANNGK